MKTECTTELMDLIITQLASAPESQISRKAKKVLKAFRGPWWSRKKHTPSEKFEFLIQFSKSGEWFKTHQISSFVAELCNLETHYLKP